MPSNRSGEYRSWAYALRDTIRHSGDRPGYGRTESTRSARPSQVRPPECFTARASDTSSITAPRIAATPPARSNASRRTSEQPPAAAAVREPGRFERRNGYSWAKKYTKAGTISRSQPDSTRRRAICDTRSSRCASPAATSARNEPGRCAMSASVSSSHSASPASAARSTPCRNAHNLPVQPSGSGGGVVTSNVSPGAAAASSRANSAVPSVL